MARPKKQGLDYFPLDSNIFADKEIRALIARYGTDGFAFYAYILCEIYREKGYYLELDDDWEFFAAKDLGISRESEKQILAYLFGRSLLTKRSSTLPSPVTAITSAGIQRRYQAAVADRARKGIVEVNERFWILSEEETLPFIKVTSQDGFSGNNEGFSGKNHGLSGEKSVKESKGKKSKGKENIFTPTAEDVWFSHPDVNASFIRYLGVRAGGGSFSRAQAEALREQIQAMTQDPQEQVKIIDQSTRGGWKSFYPLNSRRQRPEQRTKGVDGFRNIEQRSYDFAELERQLLGGAGS